MTENHNDDERAAAGGKQAAPTSADPSLRAGPAETVAEAEEADVPTAPAVPDDGAASPPEPQAESGQPAGAEPEWIAPPLTSADETPAANDTPVTGPAPAANVPAVDDAPVDAVAEVESTPERSADRAVSRSAALEQLSQRQATMAAAIERLAEQTALLARNRELTDRLHGEVQVLLRGELAEAQTPLVRDVVRLTDDIERLRAVSAAADDLALVGTRVVEILARAGVEAFAPETGEPFDAALHNGVRRVPIDDERKARTVASVLKPGFRNSDGRIIRPADVEVHHFDGRVAQPEQEGRT